MYLIDYWMLVMAATQIAGLCLRKKDEVLSEGLRRFASWGLPMSAILSLFLHHSGIMK
jgi:hypothetical protein